MSTQSPKLEKKLSVSLMVDDAIEIVPGVDAGVEPHADIALFPAAAVTMTPSFNRAAIALSTVATC
jgi:hypothetical protein